MPLKYDIGQKFPDHSLENDSGNLVSISDLAGRLPLFVVFYRGPW